MKTLLENPVAEITINHLDDGLFQVSVTPHGEIFIPIRNCQTTYPISLIKLILETKGADYLCDEICRDIDPEYVQADLEHDLVAYFGSDDFQGKRILDFGCGSGASSMILSRMYPNAEIIGVELDQDYLGIARKRLEHYGYDNVSFYSSPSGNELPDGIGEFDLVIMSAVYEHLLPEERKTVMPLVWSVIKKDGSFFLNMTPNRWFPIEHHTTGLPLLNFLPRQLALPFARAFSNRIDKKEPWDILLRRGIRGATEGEIKSILSKSQDKAVLLDPKGSGIRDRIDLWFSRLNKERHALAKKSVKSVLKTFRALTGVTLVPNLSLVIKKTAL